MENNTEYIKIGNDYYPVVPGRGTHVIRNGRIIPKHFWRDIFVDVLALGAIIFGTMIVLGYVCAICGAG